MQSQTTLFDWLNPRPTVENEGFEGGFDDQPRITTQPGSLHNKSPNSEELGFPQFSEYSSFESMRERVLQTMLEIKIAGAEEIEELQKVPLNRLRKDATRLHAVCRFRRKAGSEGPLSTSDVREVALHPVAFEQRWSRYAHFLLYHEFLHALGNIGHNRQFRDLESLWPDEKARGMGKEFGSHLRARQKRWLWSCHDCGKQHPRSRKSNGRYLCRKCGTRLQDIRIERQAP
jgi:predicted SprT family Zn-dependent metalloprotease